MRRFEKSKKVEERKCVMGEMRELARLFLVFKSLIEDNTDVCTEDMFTRKTLPILQTTEKMTESESGEKHG